MTHVPCTDPTNVRVTYRAGAYVTQTVHGQRASSTMSAEQAVKVLATKLYSSCACAVRQLPAKGLQCAQSIWRIDPQ